MKFQQHTLTVISKDPIQVMDLTEQVRACTTKCGFKNGLVVVSSHHTTMAIVMNERCEELQKDMIAFLKKIAPPEGDYRHDRVASDGRPNAHSHLLSLLIPSQVTVILKDGTLQLGTWQSLFAVELDGPRPERRVHVTVMGE